MSVSASRIDLCSVDEVKPGTPIKVEAGDLTLAVYLVDGEFFVTDDDCTHGPGSLSEGYLDGHGIKTRMEPELYTTKAN